MKSSTHAGGGVPSIRLRAANASEPRPDGAFVLYWPLQARRTRWSFPLQRAVQIALSYGKPLVVVETLDLDYRWASDRFHRFALDGMEEQRAALEGRPVLYYPFVERSSGESERLLGALAERACAVVSDDYPCSRVPDHQKKLAGRIPVRMELVDGNGLLPMRAAERVYSGAYHFRRFLQANLPEHLLHVPLEDPLDARLPTPAPDLLATERAKWPEATLDELRSPDTPGRLPIDHGVAPVTYRGGPEAARRALETFVDARMSRYADGRSHPDDDACSGLSPYLHFGHMAVHEVFESVAESEGWTHADLGDDATGDKAGWWGMSEGAEAFLDELVTWRELGFNLNARANDYAEYGSLPDWARQTLEAHAKDPRPHLYSMEDLEAANTSDPVWNAAQRKLLKEGRIQGYLRMLWGKKILEWTPDPEGALEIMIDLNDRYATDGSDPNSYSGICWVLGRYDRPWPERPVFGKVRTMTSNSAKKKLRMKGYLERFGEGA